jgi:hypothetical protein
MIQYLLLLSPKTRFIRERAVDDLKDKLLVSGNQDSKTLQFMKDFVALINDTRVATEFTFNSKEIEEELSKKIQTSGSSKPTDGGGSGSSDTKRTAKKLSKKERYKKMMKAADLVQEKHQVAYNNLLEIFKNLQDLAVAFVDDTETPLYNPNNRANHSDEFQRAVKFYDNASALLDKFEDNDVLINTALSIIKNLYEIGMIYNQKYVNEKSDIDLNMAQNSRSNFVRILKNSVTDLSKNLEAIDEDVDTSILQEIENMDDFEVTVTNDDLSTESSDGKDEAEAEAEAEADAQKIHGIINTITENMSIEYENRPIKGSDTLNRINEIINKTDELENQKEYISKQPTSKFFDVSLDIVSNIIELASIYNKNYPKKDGGIGAEERTKKRKKYIEGVIDNRSELMANFTKLESRMNQVQNIRFSKLSESLKSLTMISKLNGKIEIRELISNEPTFAKSIDVSSIENMENNKSDNEHSSLDFFNDSSNGDDLIEFDGDIPSIAAFAGMLNSKDD